MTYIESLFSLQGKTAVVIGGTGVLCGEIAQAMAGAGAEVVLVGRNEEKAKERIDAISEIGGRAHFVAGDIATPAGFEELIPVWVDPNMVGPDDEVYSCVTMLGYRCSIRRSVAVVEVG